MKVTSNIILATAAVLVAPTLAQNATSSISAPTATSTDLTSLVSQLPQCALGCLEESASSINCTTSDLPCLCSKSSQLVSAIGPCILTSSCNSNEQSRLDTIAKELCGDVSSSSPSQIAAASSAVDSAIASASSTANGSPALRTTAPMLGVGLMAAAVAWAASSL